MLQKKPSRPEYGEWRKALFFQKKTVQEDLLVGGAWAVLIGFYVDKFLKFSRNDAHAFMMKEKKLRPAPIEVHGYRTTACRNTEDREWKAGRTDGLKLWKLDRVPLSQWQLPVERRLVFGVLCPEGEQCPNCLLKNEVLFSLRSIPAQKIVCPSSPPGPWQRNILD